MRDILLLTANIVSLSLVLLFNALAGSGLLTGDTVGAISRKYPTLIVPANYAFSIWGLIFLGLTAWVVYQVYAYAKDWQHTLSEVLHPVGYWFALANFANLVWLICWLHEALAVSVVVMLFLLFCLVQWVVRLRPAMWDAPLPVMVLVWWPTSLYLGWICLATPTNIAAFLIQQSWMGGGLMPRTWAFILLAVAAGIYAFLLYKKKLRLAAWVGVWGFLAIAIRRWRDYPDLADTALTLAVFLAVLIVQHMYAQPTPSLKEKWQALRQSKPR